MESKMEKILSRKLSSLFPGREDAARDLLSEYGREGYEEEPVRVRLAALKLSGGSIEKLGREVREAKIDYRDVLARAEYPAQIRAASWTLSAEENRARQVRDLRQYEAWLKE